MQRTHVMWAALGAVLVLTVLYGCSGDGGESNRGAPGGRVTTNSQDVVERVLDILLGDDGVSQGSSTAQRVLRVSEDAGTRQEDVHITVPCETGEASFDREVTRGTGGNFTIEGTVAFASCEGIDGEITLRSTGTIGSRQINISVTINGSISGKGCDIAFEPVSAETTATRAGIIIAPVIANGTIRATCDGESTVCTLEDIDLEDRDAFEASCST